MNCQTKEKLCKFLDRKMREIYDVNRDSCFGFDLYYIRTVKGFDKSNDKNLSLGDGYNFTNNKDCQCSIRFKGEKNKRILVSITIDGISSNSWHGNIGMLYRCMDKMNEIAVEFRKYKGRLEKQDKVNNIAANSINIWLKTLMQNQPYSYYITESENKIILSVKIKYRMQLDIPIYFDKFQKIIPELTETIQQFEKTANKSKIKLMISSSRSNQQWITQTSKQPRTVNY